LRSNKDDKESKEKERECTWGFVRGRNIRYWGLSSFKKGKGMIKVKNIDPVTTTITLLNGKKKK